MNKGNARRIMCVAGNKLQKGANALNVVIILVVVVVLMKIVFLINSMKTRVCSVIHMTVITVPVIIIRNPVPLNIRHGVRII